MIVKSPITNSSNTKLIKSIDVKFLIEGYLKTYGMDVSHFFEGFTTIDLYRCLDTGYLFFYPYSVSGDSLFYEQLQKFDWYYMDWKWENGVAEKFIKQDDRVLEIGSGKGAFLKHLKNKNIKAHGLELNTESVRKGKEDGLSISNETIQEHSQKNSAYYDVVYSFQVMEHISEIGSVLNASVNTLKKGGKLIICVPNNDSFLLKDRDSLLNMPPHHMGLWDVKAFKSLEKCYPIKLTDSINEPLQPYHYDWYYEIFLLEINIYSNRLMRYTDKLVNYIFKKALAIFANKIKGHSILVVFEKL